MALISVSNNALSNITALPASIPTGALVSLRFTKEHNSHVGGKSWH